MKKIFFLNSTLNIGGAEKMFYEMLKNLDGREFTKKVCCMYGPGKIGERLISEGMDLNHSLMKNKYDIRAIYKLFQLLKKEDVDVLCIESSPLTLFWGFICAKLLGISGVVTFVHNMKRPGFWTGVKTDIINRIVLPRLASIGVASQAKLESLLKEYKLDKSKLVLIQNGIDISKFDQDKNKNELYRAIGIYEDEKIIGMVGRLVYEKAYDVFLKSAREIAAVIPESKFLIIGEGKERQNLERLADNLGIKGRVIFLGERNDISELVNLFNVAVLSSRMESFPIALLEYMACSKPIIATDVGGNSEIIKDGETGVLVSPEDHSALAGAIIKLLNNEDMARKIGQTARKTLENKFSLGYMTEKIQKFFMDINSEPIKNQIHIIMAGPSLEVKGGISGFARYYLKQGIFNRFKIIYLSTTVDGNKIIKLFFYIKSLVVFINRLIFDRKVRIVHICSSSEGSFYRKAIILLIAKIFKKKAIFHIHGSRFYNRVHSLRRFCMKKALDAADSILVLSKKWVFALKQLTDNKNIKMIPNAIDASDFKSIDTKKENFQPNILAVGRLSKQKGTYDILDIIPLVVKEIPEAKFYFAGDGDVEKVKELCARKGIEKNVILLGWLDRNKLLDALKNASIFLLPSYQECFPISILEAMAAGLPVISTNVGGIPEIIKNSVNGFLIEPGQTQELYKKVMQLLNNGKLCKNMGKNNIEKAEAMFSLNSVKSMFALEYENLMQKKHKSHDKFMWYLKRLSCMSFEEILFRLYKSMQINLDRFFPKGVNLRDVLKKEKINRRFYFDADKSEAIRQEFKKLFSDTEKAIVNDAELTCGHNFKIFDLDWCAGRKIDWHKDILTQKTWPLRYWADIDFRNDNDSKEARFIWELNRHQHLVVLGKAYILTRDMKYSQEIKEQIFSWINGNPPYKGINWASPLELSLRLISWCWAYKFIELSGIFSEKNEFLKSVYLQAEFIKNNLSRYSSANNHLIGEAAGLVITALTFPEFKNSDKWLNKGNEILFNEILKQVSSDGVTKEQAFHYQGFIMELFLLAGTLLMKNNIKISQSALNRFLSMNEFIMNLINKKGNIAQIGDSDNGMAIRLSSDKEFNLYASLLASASILSGREDFKAKGKGFKEEHYWLFGIDGFEKYASINSVDPKLNSRLFKEGGYVVFRKPSNNCKEEILMMDCGELGYPLMAPHGHADLLSITLSVDGIDLLIDPGTYLYHTGNGWRDYFRGTSAHNTITINNKNQSEIKGPFMWGKRPVACIHKWKVSDENDCLSASYDNSGISHNRSIYFNKKETIWIIHDFVAVNSRNTIRQYFHLSHDSMINRLSSNILEIENHSIFLYMLLDRDFSIEIRKGEISPILGWSSDMFGKKIENPVLVNTAFIETSKGFGTILHASRKKISLEQAKDIFERALVK